MNSVVAPRILIADDDPLVRGLVAEILAGYGAEVTAEADGEAAARAASQAPFDACVLDIEMPVLNGLDACRKIRATAFTKDVPILMLTGLNDKATIDAAFDAGASDFLNKPVHGQLLWRRILNMLTLAEVDRETRKLGELMLLTKQSGLYKANPAE